MSVYSLALLPHSTSWIPRIFTFCTWVLPLGTLASSHSPKTNIWGMNWQSELIKLN